MSQDLLYLITSCKVSDISLIILENYLKNKNCKFWSRSTGELPKTTYSFANAVYPRIWLNNFMSTVYFMCAFCYFFNYFKNNICNFDSRPITVLQNHCKFLACEEHPMIWCNLFKNGTSSDSSHLSISQYFRHKSTANIV